MKTPANEEMEQTITVRVTQKNIDEGSANSCDKCPIALALRDLGHEFDVTADYIFDGPGRFIAALPARAVHFIEDFDLGREVAPITFRVTL
jgi:hypothetical protein